METQKKTIVWEDNTEPPKNYIWIKPDNIVYQYNPSTEQWEKSKYIHSVISGNMTWDDIIEAIPTKTSELQNDSGFIKNTVVDLKNYYLKTDTYSAEEINNIVSTVIKNEILVVTSLPEPSDLTTHNIYLVPSGQVNVKDEYITVKNNGEYSWEKIGTTTINLADYPTISQMNSAIRNALNPSQRIFRCTYDPENAGNCTTWSAVQEGFSDAQYLLVFDTSTGGTYISTEFVENDHATFNGVYNNKLITYTVNTLSEWTKTESVSGIFTAIYDVTTIEEIRDAVIANMYIIAKDNIRTYQFQRLYANPGNRKLTAIFVAAGINGIQELKAQSSNNGTVWSLDGINCINADELSLVATSGNYNDLTNKPIIPKDTFVCFYDKNDSDRCTKWDQIHQADIDGYKNFILCDISNNINEWYTLSSKDEGSFMQFSYFDTDRVKTIEVMHGNTWMYDEQLLTQCVLLYNGTRTIETIINAILQYRTIFVYKDNDAFSLSKVDMVSVNNEMKYKVTFSKVNTDSFSIEEVYVIGDQEHPNDDEWSYASFPIQKISAGISNQRPTDVSDGFMYFDTELGKPIWFFNDHWVDSSGTTV